MPRFKYALIQNDYNYRKKDDKEVILVLDHGMESNKASCQATAKSICKQEASGPSSAKIKTGLQTTDLANIIKQIKNCFFRL